jgi:hypothetical protein
MEWNRSGIVRRLVYWHWYCSLPRMQGEVPQSSQNDGAAGGSDVSAARSMFAARGSSMYVQVSLLVIKQDGVSDAKQESEARSGQEAREDELSRRPHQLW